ncbi:MAG: aldehyde dehydrogenase family protein, partial [Actinomycetota bacterium]|nr:aldehyde dehydrogenase family protein [Actinomycetota bacterium]
MSQYAVVDPSTGETIKEYPTITDAELQDAIARAHAAHAQWIETTSVAERAAIVRRIGELHEQHA